MDSDSCLVDATFRRSVALRALYWLQHSIDANGGVYSGSLVPNFTSVAHILADTSIVELRAMVAQYPQLDPRREPVF